jgi:hypothetical protein
MAIGNTIIDEQLRRVRLLSETLAWVETFDTATKEQVLDWIREDQLRSKGVNKFGEVIGYYSRSTESISKGKKRFNTHYTLFDTGDFYRSMFVTVTGDSLFINANAKKGQDDLFQKFGTSIIGLTDENFAKLKEKVKTSYIEYARKTLFGNR